MKVLSLFDGMACGALAMQKAGIEIESYHAYENDKYAIQTSSHNFPQIQHHGDVFEANFKEFKNFDILIGGSPCTYWSIAQKNHRETEASGLGWELFSAYVKALKEATPEFFIYENNKSMSSQIRQSISETFGFEPIMINSALLSAQKRERLYWVGKRNPDGNTYSKVDFSLPEDKHILLKDILDSGVVDREKAYCLKHQAGNARDYLKKHHTQVAFEKIDGPVRLGDIGSSSQGNRVYSCYGKSVNITASGGGQGGKTGLYFCPVDKDDQRKPIYTVKNGLITYNDTSYPINLEDGTYVIRKLSVAETMRLQTVPEWYQFPVSETQARKLLGNGWTIDVIAYILEQILKEK